MVSILGGGGGGGVGVEVEGKAMVQACVYQC